MRLHFPVSVKIQILFSKDSFYIIILSPGQNILCRQRWRVQKQQYKNDGAIKADNDKKSNIKMNRIVKSDSLKNLSNSLEIL